MNSDLNLQDPVFGVFIFIFGLLVGSFLNVCIYRMPRGESIVTPGSHCPGCGRPVAWYDNVPLLSYLILKAKCRSCQQKISGRYFLTELLCGLLWFGLWKIFGMSAMLAAGIVLFSILLAVTFTDFETGLIPDALSYPGMILGLLISALAPQIQGRDIWYEGLGFSVLGLLAGGGIIYAMALIGDWIFKKDSMGGGDIKLLAMIGAFLGWKKIIFVFFMAPFTALPYGLYMKYLSKSKSETSAFGPFLALTGAIFFIWGDWIISFFGF